VIFLGVELGVEVLVLEVGDDADVAVLAEADDEVVVVVEDETG
jgi:hypothetical protein